ncbi:MAG: cell division protein ZapA [Muribaculaceae bacterium]|jgi:cell division protein ZapA (FtsZ GTPase activity inhibitor)|nr:cell division protein ZapA [Muribaculaceae bacterium]
MKDKLDITLKIADVELSLNIDRNEEELLREVAKQVNHAYEKYRQWFSDSPSEEILAKVTLLFAKGFLQLKQQLTELDSLLEDFDSEFSALLRES